MHFGDERIRIEIERHRNCLEGEWGHPVSFEEAEQHWTQHCMTGWKQAELQRYMELQRQEILKHKWIESEKARRDLGQDAVMDWIHRYAASWREGYQQEYYRNAEA